MHPSNKVTTENAGEVSRYHAPKPGQSGAFSRMTRRNASLAAAIFSYRSGCPGFGAW